MSILKARRLRMGDTVGIVSPSSSIAAFPRRLERGLASLEKSGFKARLGEFALESFGQNAGTPEQRAYDINQFFSDDSVAAIVCTTGGWNANAVLPLLDYDLISKKPKIFCGFSDITAINLAIYAKTGLITFNGPTILPSFGEFDGIDPYTLEYFLKATASLDPIGEMPLPGGTTSEILWWETEDNRARTKTVPESLRFLNATGISQGKVMGGNLITLCILGGTEYMPDFTDAILFLEEEGESTSSLERRMHYLAQLGILEKIGGLVFGRPSNFRTDSWNRTMEDILLDFSHRYGFPVVMNLDAGHTAPFVTLPIGAMAEIDGVNGIFRVIEPAVC